MKKRVTDASKFYLSFLNFVVAQGSARLDVVFAFVTIEAALGVSVVDWKAVESVTQARKV